MRRFARLAETGSPRPVPAVRRLVRRPRGGPARRGARPLGGVRAAPETGGGGGGPAEPAAAVAVTLKLEALSIGHKPTRHGARRTVMKGTTPLALRIEAGGFVARLANTNT
eukprot:1183853-Prorocentrum_minimum.AAC.1